MRVDAPKDGSVSVSHSAAEPHSLSEVERKTLSKAGAC